MTYNELILRVESLSIKADNIASLGATVRDAIVYGPNDISTYEDTLSLLCDMLRDQQDIIENLVNDAHANQRDAVMGTVTEIAAGGKSHA